jgi:hypothetical protein
VKGEVWVRRVFFALALLYVIPFWTVHYLPTVDGPCHTYNAWVVRQYGNASEYSLFQRYYEINTKPYPNWLGHGALALMMFAIPPLVAEKLFVSLYALLFLAGVWVLVGSVQGEPRWTALLGFPFVYNHLFQFGFYNFCASLALFCWILGFWWRRRERPDLACAIGVNLLLWLCYFSHIVSFGLSLLGIALLWAATLRRDHWRRHLLHVLALSPQLVLPLWYFSHGSGEVYASNWPFSLQVLYFFGLQGLVSFEGFQRQLATVLAGLFAVLVVLTFWRRPRPVWRESDAFLLLAVVFAVLYFLSPEGLEGGGLLKQRLSLYPFLVLIPWVSPRLARRGRQVAVAALVAVALLNAGYLARLYRALSGTMAVYVRGLDAVRPDTRLLPLMFDREVFDVLGHAASYAALEKGLIDWDNYEAVSWFFPTQFRATAPPPDIREIESEPGLLLVRKWKDRADYIYTWRMRPGDPFAWRLQRSFDPISTQDQGILWQRRPPS